MPAIGQVDGSLRLPAKELEKPPIRAARPGGSAGLWRASLQRMRPRKLIDMPCACMQLPVRLAARLSDSIFDVNGGQDKTPQFNPSVQVLSSCSPSSTAKTDATALAVSPFVANHDQASDAPYSSVDRPSSLARRVSCPSVRPRKPCCPGPVVRDLRSRSLSAHLSPPGPPLLSTLLRPLRIELRRRCHGCAWR